MGPQILTSEGALQPRISRPYEDKQRRAECLQLILVWTGAKLDQGEYERADVNATDNKKNTCLHYAAASGMKTCVEVSFLRMFFFFLPLPAQPGKFLKTLTFQAQIKGAIDWKHKDKKHVGWKEDKKGQINVTENNYYLISAHLYFGSLYHSSWRLFTSFCSLEFRQ